MFKQNNVSRNVYKGLQQKKVKKRRKCSEKVFV